MILNDWAVGGQKEQKTMSKNLARTESKKPKEKTKQGKLISLTKQNEPEEDQQERNKKGQKEKKKKERKGEHKTRPYKKCIHSNSPGIAQ